MPEFKTCDAYYFFAESVRKNRRYIYNDETQQFLDCLLETSKTREATWPADVSLWRAQLHKEYGDPVHEPFCAERMKPLPERCAEGRANPKGIPFLYLAVEPKTAMSEVRPWVGAIGTLGKFMPVRELSLIDCLPNELPYRSPLAPEPPPEEREQRVWAEVNRAFSKPIRTTDSTADYAPTQIIAEQFRSAKKDGIMFGSSLAKDGLNVVLFDLALADIADDDRKLFRTEALEGEFVVDP